MPCCWLVVQPSGQRRRQRQRRARRAQPTMDWYAAAWVHARLPVVVVHPPSAVLLARYGQHLVARCCGVLAQALSSSDLKVNRSGAPRTPFSSRAAVSVDMLRSCDQAFVLPWEPSLGAPLIILAIAGHGTCGSVSGACECHLGFAGSACALTCPVFGGQVCSGRGKCLSRNRQAYCECVAGDGLMIAGYHGEACQHSLFNVSSRLPHAPLHAREASAAVALLPIL